MLRCQCMWMMMFRPACVNDDVKVQCVWMIMLKVQYV